MATPLTINQKKTLLYRIDASLGTGIFRRVYANQADETIDILRDGQVSCAVYVSSLLVWAKALSNLHATVASLERGLQDAGWQSTDTISPGVVIIWETAAQEGGESHEHAGFAVNAYEAVSHSDAARTPVRHHITYGTKEDGSPVRRIKAMYQYSDWV